MNDHFKEILCKTFLTKMWFKVFLQWNEGKLVDVNQFLLTTIVDNETDSYYILIQK